MAANGRLEVLVVEAEGIRDRDKCILGCMNWANPCKMASKPYVHIVYGDQEQTSSVGKGRGKKKEWHEKFTFEAKYPVAEEEEEKDHVYKLVLRIMDKHKYSPDEYVGQTTVYIKDILSIGAERGKLEVEPRLYRIVESDKTYSGQISIAVTFLKAQEEEAGGWKESAAAAGE